MNIADIRFVFAALTAVMLGFGGMNVRGQSAPPLPPPPPPAAALQNGPTLEETYQFMKKVSDDLSPVTYSYTMRYETAVDDGSWRPRSSQESGTFYPVAIGYFYPDKHEMLITYTRVDDKGVQQITNKVVKFSEYAPTSVLIVDEAEEMEKFVLPDGQNSRNHKITDLSPDFWLVKAGTGGNITEFGPFGDKTLAERFAKALIHAAALCHKDEGPSPF